MSSATSSLLVTFEVIATRHGQESVRSRKVSQRAGQVGVRERFHHRLPLVLEDVEHAVQRLHTDVVVVASFFRYKQELPSEQRSERFIARTSTATAAEMAFAHVERRSVQIMLVVQFQVNPSTVLGHAGMLYMGQMCIIVSPDQLR